MSNPPDPDVNWKGKGAKYIGINGSDYQKNKPLGHYKDLAKLTKDFLEAEDIELDDWLELLVDRKAIDSKDPSKIKVKEASYLFANTEEVKDKIGSRVELKQDKKEFQEQLQEFPDDEIGQLARREFSIDMARKKTIELYPHVIQRLVQKVENENSTQQIKNASREIRHIDEHISEIEEKSRNIKQVPINQIEEELIRVVEEANKEARGED